MRAPLSCFFSNCFGLKGLAHTTEKGVISFLHKAAFVWITMPRQEGFLVILCGDFRADFVGGGRVLFGSQVYWTTSQEEIANCNCPACEFLYPEGQRRSGLPPLDLSTLNPRKRAHAWATKARANVWQRSDRPQEGEVSVMLSLGAGKLCGILSFGAQAKVSKPCVGPDKTHYGAVARPSATLALIASGGYASIRYPLDVIPNAIADLILGSLDNRKLMLAEGTRGEALAGVAFSRVQVATLSSSHIRHACITPFDLSCHEFRHYANDIAILRHGVGPLGKAKDAFLWHDRQWVSVETETPSEDDEGEEQLSDGFIASDAEAGEEVQEHISIEEEEEEEEEEEDPFQSGESESPEENPEEDHAEPHIESRRQSARATKRRLDDTSERLLHIEKKRPAAATAATKPPKDGRMCSICLTEPSDHVIYPCGHSAFCDGCFRNPQLNSSVCPLCKAKAELVMSIEMHAKISSMIVYWS